MKAFNIRLSNKNDFEEVFRIWLQSQKMATGNAIPSGDVQTLKSELHKLFYNTSRAIFYVAETDPNTLVGWQALLPLLSNPLISEYTAQSSTYIDIEYYNNNVATKLLKYAITDAKRLKIEHIYGWVKADNNAINEISSKFSKLKYSIPASNNLPSFNLYIVEVK